MSKDNRCKRFCTNYVKGAAKIEFIHYDYNYPSQDAKKFNFNCSFIRIVKISKNTRNDVFYTNFIGKFI